MLIASFVKFKFCELFIKCNFIAFILPLYQSNHEYTRTVTTETSVVTVIIRYLQKAFSKASDFHQYWLPQCSKSHCSI